MPLSSHERLTSRTTCSTKVRTRTLIDRKIRSIKYEYYNILLFIKPQIQEAIKHSCCCLAYLTSRIFIYSQLWLMHTPQECTVRLTVICPNKGSNAFKRILRKFTCHTVQFCTGVEMIPDAARRTGKLAQPNGHRVWTCTFL